MSYTDKYANFDLNTGSNNGTSEADAWQTLDDCINGLTAGIRVNIKKQSAPYGITTDIVYDLSTVTGVFGTSPATATSPILFLGYESVTGDGGMWSAELDGVTVGLKLDYAEFISFENISIRATPTTNSSKIIFNNAAGSYRNCNFVGSHLQFPGSLDRCYIGLSSAGSIYWATLGSQTFENYLFRGSFSATNCVFEHIQGSSLFTTLFYLRTTLAGPAYLSNCIFLSRNTTTDPGLYLLAPSAGEGVVIDKCRFYGFGDAIVVAGDPDNAAEIVSIQNCVFEDCNRAVYRNDAIEDGYVKLINNYYRNLTTGFTNYSDEAQINNTPLTADAFTDPANGNLLVNSVAGGGQVIRDAGGSYDNGGTFETPSEFFGTMFEEGGGSVTPVTYTYFG